MKPARLTVLWFLSVIAALYALYAVAMVLLHPRFIYPFADVVFADSAFRAQSVVVPGKDPLTVQVAQGEADAPVVLFFMGNVGALELFRPMLAEHLAAGRTVVAMPFRGGGGVPGAASESTLKHDALAVAADVQARFAGRPLFLHGYSLGTGLAVHVAGRHDIDGLILSAPYDAMCRLMARASKLPACYLPVQRWRTDRDVAGIGAPVLILHGVQDQLIPLAHGARLAEILRQQQLNVTFAQIERAGHNDLTQFAQHKALIDSFVAWSLKAR